MAKMINFKKYLEEKRGLWDNIHAKRKRIKAGSGERMRKPGSKGAPTDADFKAASESFEHTFDMLEEAVKAIDSGEYDYEGQMARTQLQTILRNSKDLVDMLSDEENMPEWVQSKITLAQDYITSVRDYLQSKEELSEDTIEAQFDLIEDVVTELALINNVDPETLWEKLEELSDEELLEYAIDAKGHKSSTGGLTQKGVDAYNRKTGGNLQTAVTTPPSKLKPGSKAANRRKSFCARMGGMPGPMKDDKGEPTRKALALRKWNC
jgi:exonuclease VII small subunit